MDSPAIYLFDSLRLVPVGSSTDSPLDIRSVKLQAMLAFLILHRGAAIERPRLGKALWPESDDRTARRYVREYLYRARKLLSDFVPDQEVLQSDEACLTFNPGRDCWIDVAEFERLVDQAGEVSLQERVACLRRAISLYTGHLLDNLYGDWLQTERARFRARLMDALQQLSEGLQTTGDLPGAIATTQRMLNYEPLQEAVHRRLMELHYLHGDRAKALQQYESCRKLLAEELAATPMYETNALYQSILSGSYRTGPIVTPAPPPPAHRSGSPFIGRRAALTTLTEVMEQVRRNELQFFLIRGDSGIGKTRLAEEWLARLSEEVIVLRGRAHEFEQEIPYRPLLDALQQSLQLIPWNQLPGRSSCSWLAPLARLLPDLYYYLPDLSSTPAAEPGEGQHQIMEALAQLLLSLARQVPIVLFLDDLHWGDPGTWQTLSFLARRIPSAPLLVLGAFSTSGATDAGKRRCRLLEQDAAVHSLILPPLSRSHHVELVYRMLGTSSMEQAERVADPLYRLCKGNPFLTVETLGSLLAQGDSFSPDELEHLPLPATVDAFIQNRLDRLEESSRQTLAIAAAIGMHFDPALLVEIIGNEDRIIGYLDAWTARGLVDEKASGYRFRYDQIREVAYQQLSGPRRRRVHFQIARLLERREPQDRNRVAYHYGKSDRKPRW